MSKDFKTRSAGIKEFAGMVKDIANTLEEGKLKSVIIDNDGSVLNSAEIPTPKSKITSKLSNLNPLKAKIKP